MADSVRPDAVTAEKPAAWDPDVLEEPLGYDQATLAVTLCDSLRLHRDQKKLLWHVEVNEKVEFRLADGTRRGVFPDLYLVLGIPQLPSGVYRTWARGKSLDLVVEFSTPDSIASDRGDKLAVYRDALRVAEYFVLDIGAVAIEGQLEGYRLDAGVYRPIEPVRSSTGYAKLPSKSLGLDLGLEANPVTEKVELRAFVPGTVAPLLTREEAVRARAEADRTRAEAELEEYRRRFGPLRQS